MRPSRDDIREVVRLAVSNAQTTRYVNERRRDRRYPFPHPIRLVPVAPDGEPMRHCELVVIGKSVTERGLDFYHTEPVAHRHVIVWLPCGPTRWLGLAVELTWCRFNGYGWYENGGKFSRVVSELRNDSANQKLLSAGF